MTKPFGIANFLRCINTFVHAIHLCDSLLGLALLLYCTIISFVSLVRVHQKLCLRFTHIWLYASVRHTWPFLLSLLISVLPGLVLGFATLYCRSWGQTSIHRCTFLALGSLSLPLHFFYSL